jgi:peptidoglycan/LPS O-acetylase OafA/YrhL
MLVAIGVPLVLAMSYLFHRIFERPFLVHRSVGSLISSWAPGRNVDSRSERAPRLTVEYRPSAEEAS